MSYEVNEVSSEHPTAHLRPKGRQRTEEKEDKNPIYNHDKHPGVQLVTPVYGEFVPNVFATMYNTSDQGSPRSSEDESVIQDITGTTVYVVGVISVIPVAGLVAWVVRYVVKKKVGSTICYNNASYYCFRLLFLAFVLFPFGMLFVFLSIFLTLDYYS